MNEKHLTDDALELYSLKRLPESELDAFEDHLLICASCQDRLAETDAYVRTMQSALTQIEREDSARRKSRAFAWGAWLNWRPAWGIAMAAALILVVAVPMYRRTLAPSAVELTAVRGESQLRAKAGRPFHLRLEAGTTTSTGPFTVEVVDTGGGQKTTTPATLQNGYWTASLEDGLRAGQYWVRVYSGQPSQELLREYALALD